LWEGTWTSTKCNNLRTSILILFLILLAGSASGKGIPEENTIIYLFPGQGSDARLFKHLQVPRGYDTAHITFPVPQKRESLSSYANRFIPEIDPSVPFILMGVSMGGMICTELTDTLEPLKTIIISSAKTTSELPGRYTFQQKIHLNRIIPKKITKGGARILQGIVEPDRKHDPETFKAMLKAKDPSYLQRTVDMIINWDRTEYDEQIIHIHGNKDHTIPIKNIHYDYLVEEGSHMMMITRAAEINQIIDRILNHTEHH